ncbi:MAG TPA: hypothetical protein VEL80_04630, partial [Burkholderiales bacterium]|nr:hypothetical protein [Burkholderiales bacterium]
YSAGLINYFFRGKIDILPDPQNPGSHLVKNLGPEPMAGKFTLYYDTVDGNRQPVSDASGSPLVWDTRVILASSDGVLPPNTDMPVTGFIAPSDPAPKRVGEYMLVFAGDMGEEKADEASGVVGAVAAKFIEVTPGTLYLAAVDANNNYVGLRADKNGTKVLSGEFDPLAGLVIGQTFPKVQFFNIANAHTHKQVAFTQTVNGWSYQTLGFGLPLNRFSQLQVGYVWNALLNSFTQTSGRPWIAKSPDPTIGTFQFFFFNFSGKAFLNYNRQFVDSTGATRTTLGQVSLPDSTDLAFYLLDVGFISGELPVSPDGLHVGEFPVSTITTTGDIQCGSFQQVTNKQYYELLITLSATPTAQLNAVANITDTASGTSTCRFGSRLSIAESSHSTDRIFIGNFIGGKQIYIHTLDFSVSGSASTSVSGSDSSGWQRLCQENTDFFGNFQNQLAHTYQFPDGTLTGTITCNESVGRQYSGQPGVIGLSQHASDAIYTQPAPPSNPRYFRGTLLGEGFYIADASPLGEVFVATADLSVVIHDPLPGGMPKVVIPPGIVKLLAALWL